MRVLSHPSSQLCSPRLRCALRSFAASAVLVLAVLAPPAAADSVYHSQHLKLTPVGGAPLRSGFVENIKAEGPKIYAHEIFVLNGAVPRAGYAVTRNLFPFDPDCSGENGAFASKVADLTTNANGNARGDAKVAPADVAGFEGVHGVFWTVADAAGTVVYRTACTAVTLD
jgi:hypothetical protein